VLVECSRYLVIYSITERVVSLLACVQQWYAVPGYTSIGGEEAMVSSINSGAVEPATNR
jgi:hypothetical protein